MQLQNSDIAAIFEEIAEYLDILGENPFRSRAYLNAALTLRSYGPNIARLLADGKELPKLPNVGPDLSQKIHEIVRTGQSSMHQRLRKQVPPGLVELLQLPGIGPKRARALWKGLGIHSVEDLKEACSSGRIHELRGFGAKFEAQLQQALATRADQTGRRFPLGEVSQLAERFVTFLQAVRGVHQATAAGSVRRGRETVGDLDLIVAADQANPVTDRFLAVPDIAETLAHGETKTSVRLSSALQVDLRVVPPESYGAALHYFTGSKAHNIAVRQLGQKHGLKINEYGVFRGSERIAGETEESVFASVGLPYIPPELREDNGEIEAALAGEFPHIVSREDLRGDLHCHTVASDGRDSLEAMAEAAKERGLSYLAITEHSRSLSIAHGLDEKRLGERLDEIEGLNKKLRGITLLKGAEVDILEDGSLDYPDSLLKRLDIVIASVHSRFGETREQQTKRILRAMENPYVTILGHPTGRRMPRPPYDLDMERIFKQAKRTGCVLELNSQPERLDLNDAHCKLAKEHGVMVSIDSDAHSTLALDNVRFGVAQARRAGLEPGDVLNTRSLPQLRKLIAARRP